MSLNGATTSRTKDPLTELIIWLLCIWSPVVYVYTSGRHDQGNKAISHVPTQSAKEPIRTTKNGPLPSTSTPDNRVGEQAPKSLAPPPKPTTRAERGSVSNQVSAHGGSASNIEDGSSSQHDANIIEKKDVIESKEAQRVSEAITSPPGHVEASLPQEPFEPTADTYLAMVKKRISHLWHVPSANQSLEAVIKIRLESSGYISEIIIEQSSGDEVFDFAAKRAVLSVSPVLPFYPEMTEEHLETRLRFSNKR